MFAGGIATRCVLQTHARCHRPGGRRSQGLIPGIDEAEALRQRCRLCAVGRAELAQQVGHVDAHGLRADEQVVGDRGVGPALRDEVEYLAVSDRQPEGLGLLAVWTSPPWQIATRPNGYWNSLRRRTADSIGIASSRCWGRSIGYARVQWSS